MKHYRVNKVTKPDGVVIKKKDILAESDKAAMSAAAADEDCPTCDVYQAAKKIGSVT